MEVIGIQTEIAGLGLDLGAVITLVTERSRSLTSAGGAVIELAEGEDMVYRGAAGSVAGQLGLRLKRKGSLSGFCVETGQAMICKDSETDDRVDRSACRKIGLRSMIVLPLRHRENTVGALKVLSPETDAFSPIDLQLLQMISGLVGSAMYHAAQAEASELFYRATHDALTGLANRALFYDRLRNQLAQAQRHERALAIVNLDMDGLKPINDTYGHRAGDAAIREMALRIRAHSREADTVARLGGDEFGIILADVNGSAGAEERLKRLNDAVTHPFTFDKHTLPLGASIGVAVYPDHGGEIHELIDRADEAMYAVKRQRKAQHGQASAPS